MYKISFKTKKKQTIILPTIGVKHNRIILKINKANNVYAQAAHWKKLMLTANWDCCN